MDKRRVWNIAMIVIGTMAVIAVVGLVFTFVLPLSSGATKPKAYEVFSPRVKSLLASMSLRACSILRSALSISRAES